jgi:hypothetical protein
VNAPYGLLIVDRLSMKDIRRVFSRIAVNPFTSCWEWTGFRDKGGYARLRILGVPGQTVHRLLYAWAVGPIPRGQGRDIPNLDHVICNNEGCCNPVHLELSSVKDNTLRGDGPTAVNARKTHCLRGHLLTPKPNGGGRHCETCIKDRIRRIRERRRNDPEFAARQRQYWRQYDIKRGKVRG